MNIDITDDHTIGEIAGAFSSKFPFLKLVFFSAPVTVNNGILKDEIITDESKTVRDIRHKRTIGHVSISGRMKAQTLLDDFLQLYGLNVKVFQRRGAKWNNVDLDRTLSVLNRDGEQASVSGSGGR